jgi:hypothetical protein
MSDWQENSFSSQLTRNHHLRITTDGGLLSPGGVWNTGHQKGTQEMCTKVRVFSYSGKEFVYNK